MTFVTTAISAGVGIAGKAIGAGIGNKKGKEAAAEQNLLEQQNYQMQYANTVKQREQMDQQHSQNVMQSYNPQGQTQMFWGQMGGNLPIFKGGGNLWQGYEDGGQMGPYDTQSYPDRVRQSRTGSRRNEDGSESTVLMSSADNKAFATLFQDDQGGWFELPWREAMVEAERRGELYEFTSGEEAARFAEGSWKKEGSVPGKNWRAPERNKGRKPGGPRVKHMQDGGYLTNTMGNFLAQTTGGKLGFYAGGGMMGYENGGKKPGPTANPSMFAGKDKPSEEQVSDYIESRESYDFVENGENEYRWDLLAKDYDEKSTSGAYATGISTRKKGEQDWSTLEPGSDEFYDAYDVYKNKGRVNIDDPEGSFDPSNPAKGTAEFDALTQLTLGALGAGAVGKAAPMLFSSPTRTVAQRAANVAVDLVSPVTTKGPAKVLSSVEKAAKKASETLDITKIRNQGSIAGGRPLPKWLKSTEDMTDSEIKTAYYRNKVNAASTKESIVDYSYDPEFRKRLDRLTKEGGEMDPFDGLSPTERMNSQKNYFTTGEIPLSDFNRRQRLLNRRLDIPEAELVGKIGRPGDTGRGVTYGVYQMDANKIETLLQLPDTKSKQTGFHEAIHALFRSSENMPRAMYKSIEDSRITNFDNLLEQAKTMMPAHTVDEVIEHAKYVGNPVEISARLSEMRLYRSNSTGKGYFEPWDEREIIDVYFDMLMDDTISPVFMEIFKGPSSATLKDLLNKVITPAAVASGVALSEKNKESEK